VEIRISAIKEQARASIISTQLLSDSVAVKSGGEGVFTASHESHKWLWIAGAVAVGVGAGAAFFLLNRSKNNSNPTSPSGVTVGSPSIIVGAPAQ
jgi:ABC-type phosphate transport system permease subunit